MGRWLSVSSPCAYWARVYIKHPAQGRAESRLFLNSVYFHYHYAMWRSLNIVSKFQDHLSSNRQLNILLRRLALTSSPTWLKLNIRPANHGFPSYFSLSLTILSVFGIKNGESSLRILTNNHLSCFISYLILQILFKCFPNPAVLNPGCTLELLEEQS